MHDLINLQEALNEIRELYEYEFPTASGAFDEFVTIILPNLLKNLPTVKINDKMNLCEFCEYDYVECPAKDDDIVFGNGIGYDNICSCSKYTPFKSKYKSKVIVHDASITTDYGETFHREEYLCDNCKRKILSGDNFCSHCGAKLDWDALVYYKHKLNE